MEYYDDLVDRLESGELRASDFYAIVLLIFAAILTVLSLIGSILYFFYVLIAALITGSFIKLLLLVPCAIVFSITLAVLICALAALS